MTTLSPLPAKGGRGCVSMIRRMSMETYMVRIYSGPLSLEHEYVSVEAEKVTTAEEVVQVAAFKLKLSNAERYELAEVFSTSGQLCKERRLQEHENPVRVQLLWPKIVNAEYDRGHGLFTGHRFYIRKQNLENSKRSSSWVEYSDPNPVDNFLTAFLTQPTSNKEYTDLCNLPDLNERTLLENIKSRFLNSNIYTYVGSILIAVNPFKFFPIYNPIYVKMYQNKRLGDLPPHIFAVADSAFYTMLRTKKNQCIVISGESGSGKTESTNLLLHHLTALSHKGLHGSGVEQTILGAGPVLEAFGNAKTVHNNNSSRFGKFIQVNYKENGMVHGAIVEKYLLEKSRIVSQAINERNYHVFYYLLEGADDLEREKLRLGKPEDYFYLRQSDCYSLEEVDEANEFSRLKQSMEMVAFSQVTQKRIFGVLSAVLHLGNVAFKKKGDQHHDESVSIVNPETIAIISKLLMVKERTLVEALTQKKTVAGDETVVMTHRMEHAVATRDAMAKCLYGSLFDWIVLKVNQALLAKRHNSEHLGNSIGVLDIFGFEDFRWNSFEQFCINYANEHLQYYFNQHIFKFEQEEYKKEGIQWKNIEFIDNTGCLELFSKKGIGLFSLLDEECNFPGASNETLLTKFHYNHSKANVYYEAPQKREMAFTVVHYAGKVKYQVKDFREKNSDQIRTDIVANMKSSSLSFVRELMGVDPVAVLRWTIVKTLIKSMFAFISAGKTYRHRGGPDSSVIQRRKVTTDSLNIPDLGSTHVLRKNKSFKPKSRPQTMFSDIKTLKAIANRTIYIGGKVNTKQKPPSVGAQFQWSLSRLMSTLNQANPFFIRCIKSNADKLACRMNDVLVLRQLRYTGMLATVRIRQSGYNYRLTFEEFVQLYKILLPKGLSSDKEDVSQFLQNMNMNQDNYQIGKTKVFLRETEKLHIDECLHQAIMHRVVTIQRWVKTKVERKHFTQLRESTLILQKHMRLYLAQRRLAMMRDAIVFIQRWYKGSVVRRKYHLQRRSAIRIQAHIKAHLCRKRYREMEAELRKQRAEREACKQAEDMHSSTSDEGVLLKDMSEDELKLHNAQYQRHDSEESSGILDDSESDTLSEAKSRGDSVNSPPPTPTSQGPDIYLDSFASPRDEYSSPTGNTFRVQRLSNVFEHSHSPAKDDSPTTDVRISPLSPEKVLLIEEVLHKRRDQIAANLHSSADDVSVSPFKRVMDGAKHLVGVRRKKDSQAEDSDDDLEHSTPTAKHLHNVGAVSVLPPHPSHPLSPKSPIKDENMFSGDEREEKKTIPKKRPTRKMDKENRPVEPQKGWNVAKTSQWQYPEEFVITETYELQLLDEFIGRKINALVKDTGKRESQFDIVFKKCLQSFHTELKSTLSVFMQRDNVNEISCNIKYRNLFANFEVTMRATCEEQRVDSEFPVTICLNAFRGYLDEFRNNVNSKKKDSKLKKKKVRRLNARDQKKKDVIEYQGHKCSKVQFGIPTFCELCSNIIWIMERGYVCQICKYTCHRICLNKTTSPCKGAQDWNSPIVVGTKVFSVPLPSLVGAEDKIPVFMENLIMSIETHGLYTEGIYRKPGLAHKINLLKAALDTGLRDVNIEEYPVHVLTCTLKTFFRELPEPLLTFEFYDEFIQASEIHDGKEAIQVLFSLIEKLPKVNHDVLERLIFHLARVAHHEKNNKMTVNSLSIIFAPCLLRTNKIVQAQEMLVQVSRQQLCIEKILQEQSYKLRTTLHDISTLESAEATAIERLSFVRASRRNIRHNVRTPQEGPTHFSEDPETLEERVINSHIQTIREEKESLTNTLTVFEYRHSSDDEMLSADDIESTDDCEYQNDELNFDSPGSYNEIGY